MHDMGMGEAALKKEVAEIDKELDEAEEKEAHNSDSKDRMLQLFLEERVRVSLPVCVNPLFKWRCRVVSTKGVAGRVRQAFGFPAG